MNEKELIELAKKYYNTSIRWKTYVNNMRSDGLFVAEDKSIEPYKDVCDGSGNKIYPAVPTTNYLIPFQLSRKDASKLVELLNGKIEKGE